MNNKENIAILFLLSCGGYFLYTKRNDLLHYSDGLNVDQRRVVHEYKDLLQKFKPTEVKIPLPKYVAPVPPKQHRMILPKQHEMIMNNIEREHRIFIKKHPKLKTKPKGHPTPIKPKIKAIQKQFDKAEKDVWSKFRARAKFNPDAWKNLHV